MLGRHGGVHHDKQDAWRRHSLRTLVLVAAFLVSFVLTLQTVAFAGHTGETGCSSVVEQEAGVSESVGIPTGRAAVRGYLRVIDPNPNVSVTIVRSIYLWKTVDDVVEFGWDYDEGGFPIVFSVKVYNSHYFEDHTLNNPGGGPLDEMSDAHFRIHRNPDGNDPNRIEMFRDQLYYGFYNHDRLTSGVGVVTASEGFSRCEDMTTHAWALDRKLSPSGSWANWDGVRTIPPDQNTDW